MPVDKQVRLASAIRFVRIFDPVEMRIVNRFDVLYGPDELQCPMAVDAAEVLKGEPYLSEQDVADFKTRCIAKYIPSTEGVDGTVEHWVRKGDSHPTQWIHKLGE